MAESNYLYDVVTSLENKMKAVAAYDAYIQDAGQRGNRPLFEKIKRDDEGHVHLLKQELARALQSEGEPALAASGATDDD